MVTGVRIAPPRTKGRRGKVILIDGKGVTNQAGRSLIVAGAAPDNVLLKISVNRPDILESPPGSPGGLLVFIKWSYPRQRTGPRENRSACYVEDRTELRIVVCSVLVPLSGADLRSLLWCDVMAANVRNPRRRSDYGQARSKRSRFMTLFHAATKSCRNFSWESPQP